MAIIDGKKLDTLWKKLIYGVTQSSFGGKDAPNEAIASPLPAYASQIWRQDADIPRPAPASSGGVVEQRAGATAVVCVADPTVSGDKTWIAPLDPLADPMDAANRLGDWIPPTFDPSYLIKVWAGDPTADGVPLNGGMNDQEWIFDYQAGVLHFINTVPPEASAGIWIEGFRYTGPKGLPLGGGGGAVTVYDEGVLVGAATEFNFIGEDVVAMTGSTGRVNVFIPTPPFKSHWDQNDGVNGAQKVTESITRVVARISNPTAEGTPFVTNGWAGTDRPAASSGIVTFTTPQATSGFGGTSTMSVQVLGYNTTGQAVVHQTYTTPPLTGNAVLTGTNIKVTLTEYGPDAFRFSAKASVEVNIGAIFTALGQTSGRYGVRITHTTDSNTDGSGPWIYAQPEVFYDADPSRPVISGSVTMEETIGQIATKHLSGIEYYTTGSQFTLGITGIDRHNRDTQRAADSLSVTGPEYGLAALGQSPFGTGASAFTGWSNGFATDAISYRKTDWAITAANHRYIGPTGSVSATVRDPWGSSPAKDSADTLVLIDTFSGTTAALDEGFDAEDRRVKADYVTAWDSTATLAAGDAIVFGGKLMVPSATYFIRSDGANTPNADWTAYRPNLGGPNPNYISLTAPVSWFRRFPSSGTADHPSMSVVFSGQFAGANALADLISGDLQVFVRKIGGLGATGPSAPALRLHGAGYNSGTFNDGATDGGIRVGSSSANTINATFGTWPMKGGILMEVRINKPAIQIDRIAVTFS